MSVFEDLLKKEAYSVIEVTDIEHCWNPKENNFRVYMSPIEEDGGVDFTFSPLSDDIIPNSRNSYLVVDSTSKEHMKEFISDELGRVPLGSTKEDVRNAFYKWVLESKNVEKVDVNELKSKLV